MDTRAPTHAVVVVTPAGCNMCGYAFENRHHVEVQTIEQRDGIAWQLKGQGRVMAHCARCADMYEAVKTLIPIECHAYACPRCSDRQSLTFDVKRIDAKGSEFTFEVEIFCRKCNNRRSFVQILKSLLQIKKLEVKLTGITVER